MNKWKLSPNNWIIILSLQCLLTGYSQNATDQQPSSKGPLQPFVNPIEPFSEWKVKVISSPDGKPPGTRELREIHGQRTADLRCEKLTWSDSQTERWLVGNLLLETLPDRKDILVSPFSKSKVAIEKRLSTFSELNWIAAEYYRGTVEINGSTCHYFEYRKIIKSSDDPEVISAVRRGEMEMPPDIVFHNKAWIHSETKVPIASESNGTRREYDIFRNASLKLDLPSQFAQAALRNSQSREATAPSKK